MFGLFQYIQNEKDDYYYFTLTGTNYLMYSFAIEANQRIKDRKSKNAKATVKEKPKEKKINKSTKKFCTKTNDNEQKLSRASLQKEQNESTEITGIKPTIKQVYNTEDTKNKSIKENKTMKKLKKTPYSKEMAVNPKRLDLLRSRTKKKAIANIGENPYFGTFTVDSRLHNPKECSRYFKNFREACRRILNYNPPYIMTIAETPENRNQHIHILFLDTNQELIQKINKLWTVGSVKLSKIPKANEENHIRACINYIYKNVSQTLKTNPSIRRTVWVSKNLKKPNRTEIFTSYELSKLVSELYRIQKKYGLATPSENYIKIQNQQAIHIGFIIPKEKYKLMDKKDIETLLNAQCLNINFFKQAINKKLSHSDYYIIINHLYTNNIYKVYLKEVYNSEYPEITDEHTQEKLKEIINKIYKNTSKLPDINKLTSKEAINDMYKALILNPQEVFEAQKMKTSKKQFRSAVQSVKKLDKLYKKMKYNLWTKHQKLFKRFSEKLIDILIGIGYIINR